MRDAEKPAHPPFRDRSAEWVWGRAAVVSNGRHGWWRNRENLGTGMSTRLDLRLLGAFRAEIDDQAVAPDAWRQGRAASLVKLLALSPRNRLTRERVIEALWPGISPQAGGTNVRKAVHFARRALGGEGAIAVRDGLVELWPSGDVSTDVERFREASLRATSLRDGDAFREAAALYTDDLLPDDADEQWLDNRRAAL